MVHNLTSQAVLEYPSWMDMLHRTGAVHVIPGAQDGRATARAIFQKYDMMEKAIEEALKNPNLPKSIAARMETVWEFDPLSND